MWFLLGIYNNCRSRKRDQCQFSRITNWQCEQDEVSKEEAQLLRVVFETLIKRCTPSPPPPTVRRFVLCMIAAQAIWWCVRDVSVFDTTNWNEVAAALSNDKSMCLRTHTAATRIACRSGCVSVFAGAYRSVSEEGFSVQQSVERHMISPYRWTAFCNAKLCDKWMKAKLNAWRVAYVCFEHEETLNATHFMQCNCWFVLKWRRHRRRSNIRYRRLIRGTLHQVFCEFGRQFHELLCAAQRFRSGVLFRRRSSYFSGMPCW